MLVLVLVLTLVLPGGPLVLGVGSVAATEVLAVAMEVVTNESGSKPATWPTPVGATTVTTTAATSSAAVATSARLPAAHRV